MTLSGEHNTIVGPAVQSKLPAAHSIKQRLTPGVPIGACRRPGTELRMGVQGSCNDGLSTACHGIDVNVTGSCSHGAQHAVS